MTVRTYVVGFFLVVGWFCSVCGCYNYDAVDNKRSVIPVLIIGSGPAGYAAAVHCARAGFETVVLAGSLPGGQLTETGLVENWPGIKKASGNAIMDQQREQVLEAGAKIAQESAEAIDVTHWPFTVTTDMGTHYRALVLIIATGSEPITLGIPGEREQWGNGVSVCAVCDARFFTGKDVVVVGGGDSAAEQALQLAVRSHVSVLVRGAAMRASWALQQRLKRSGITVEYHKELSQIFGDEHGVHHMDVYDNKSHTHESRAIDGVFLAIGHTPRSELISSQINCDAHGYITLKGRSQATSVPGVFAAGEVADPDYKQAAVAAGDGAKAGRDAERFLCAQGLTPQELALYQMRERAKEDPVAVDEPEMVYK